MCEPTIISDEVMYDLLHHHLNQKLKRKFEVIEHQLLDSFDDVVDDFFLYLRDGKSGTNRITYQSLYRIQNPEAFEAWTLSTFRNYLSGKAAKEGKMVYAQVSIDKVVDDERASSILTDEQKLSMASNLIAYAHQTLPSRDCFILFRTLLTILDKRQAMPNEAMAKVLGMSDIAYRVTVHRMKGNLAKYRTQLLQGQPLPLDERHQAMAQKINDDFLNLYPTLSVYYNQLVETLHCADAIKNLRQEYFEQTGRLLQEDQAEYSVPVTITYFWNRLERCLFQSPPRHQTSGAPHKTHSPVGCKEVSYPQSSSPSLRHNGCGRKSNSRLHNVR